VGRIILSSDVKILNERRFRQKILLKPATDIDMVLDYGGKEKLWLEFKISGVTKTDVTHYLSHSQRVTFESHPRNWPFGSAFLLVAHIAPDNRDIELRDMFVPYAYFKNRGHFAWHPAQQLTPLQEAVTYFENLFKIK
jgi:hypothetical protein